MLVSNISLIAITIGIVSGVVSLAMLSLVSWQALHQRDNLLMATYMALLVMGSFGIVGQQVALAFHFDPLPLFWLNATIVALCSPFLFLIVTYYTDEWRSKRVRWFAVGGMVAVLSFVPLTFQGLVVDHVFYGVTGNPTYRFTWLGYLSLGMVGLYHVSSLVLMWRSKHKLSRGFFTAVLIVLLSTSTAVFNQWLPANQIPILGATISVFIFAHIIIRRSYFSPLIQLNQELENANSQLVALSHNLQEKEANLRALLTNTSDLVWSIDRDYRIITINLTAADFFALLYDHQLQEGDDIRTLIPHHEQEMWRSWYDRAFAGERVTIETQYSLPGVKEVVALEVTLNPILDDHNQITGISAFSRDITTRKDAERQLHLQALALENMNESVIITNLRGFITYCNPATEAIFGYSQEELLGQMPEIWHAPEDSPTLSQDIQSGLARDGRWDGPIRFVHKKGKRGICDAVVLPLYNDQGERIAALGVSHDVTAQKQYETELHEAKEAAEAANRAKSSFLASMSHELRTPLNAIIGYSEMLEDIALGKEYVDIARDLHRITTAGQHLLTLINDVLDLSKIEAGKTNIQLEQFLIADLINEVIYTSQNLIEKNNNQLKVSLAPDLGFMYGDMIKVRQILLNLVSNAAKFTRRGRISIQAERETASPSDLIVFTISDTGIGMTLEEMSRIFSAFTQADNSTTRQYGGTGLGLTISHRFCELLGGTITVDSQPRVGSTFVVALPAVITPQETPHPPKPAIVNSFSQNHQSYTPTNIDNDHNGMVTTIIRPALQQGIVLVISPREDHRDQMVRWLLAKRYRTYAAANGYRGLKLAKRLRPHAIVFSPNLPDYYYPDFVAEIRADAHLRQTPLLLYGSSPEQLKADVLNDDPQLHLILHAEEDLVRKVRQVMQISNPPRPRTMIQPTRILVVEDNFALRDILRLTLSKRGFEVVEAIDALMALEFLETTSQQPDLVLLDLMMPRLDGFGFVEQIRAMPSSASIPIIVVTAKPLTTDEHNKLRNKVDDILYKGIYSQNDLLRRIDQLITLHTGQISSAE